MRHREEGGREGRRGEERRADLPKIMAELRREHQILDSRSIPLVTGWGYLSIPGCFQVPFLKLCSVGCGLLCCAPRPSHPVASKHFFFPTQDDKV